jgi:hypothetical protein
LTGFDIRYSSFGQYLATNGAAPAEEYNDAGDLNKKDVLKALTHSQLIYQKRENQL